MVEALRETLLLPLDDLLAMTREFPTPRSRALAWTAVCAATACLTSNADAPGGRRQDAGEALQGV